MKANKYSVVIALFAVLCFSGCSKGDKSSDASAAKPAGAVIAEVNGKVITVDEFKKEVENLPPYLKPMTETVEGRKEMLETMVIREMILQEASKEKIEESKAVQDKLGDIKKRLIVEAYLKKKVEEKAAISDADIKKFYDENKDKFKHGEQIKASHIIVKDDKKLSGALEELKKGTPFEEVAKKYSTDGAAAKGGDLGWFGKGSMDPDFEKAAFSLKEGEVSTPVKSKFGTHLIKLTGKRGAGSIAMEEVKDQIKQAILPQKQKEVFDKVKEELKKSAKFSVKEDILKSLGDSGESSGEKAAPVPVKK